MKLARRPDGSCIFCRTLFGKWALCNFWSFLPILGDCFQSKSHRFQKINCTDIGTSCDLRTELQLFDKKAWFLFLPALLSIPSSILFYYSAVWITPELNSTAYNTVEFTYRKNVAEKVMNSLLVFTLWLTGLFSCVWESSCCQLRTHKRDVSFFFRPSAIS